MKTSNIIKTAAFVTAAAFTVSFTGSYAGNIYHNIKSDKTSIPAVPENMKLPLEAEIVEEPFSAVEKLSYACKNNDTRKISEICDGIIAELDAAKAEAKAVATDISFWADDEIISRQQSYENEISVKYAESVKALTELKNGINTEENLAVVMAELSEPEEYHRSDAAPNTAVQPVEQTIAASPKASSAEIVSPEASADDLVYDRGVSDPAAIKALADKLGSARMIYLFVKNTVRSEAYSGSKKDPCITLQQLGGNDIDQAALLIALLRAEGIPARFISGTVRITPEQAVDLTGASDADTAGRLLAARYKNTAKLKHNGEIVGYSMRRTWVEALIPYTDYRGAGSASGESVWVQLDPAFKKVEINTENVTPDFSAENSEVLRLAELNQKEYAGLYDEIDTSPESIGFHHKSKIIQNEEYIPSSLPYTVLEADQRYSFINDSDRASVSISINGENLLSAFVSDIYGNPLVVSYEPASDSDRDVIDHYGDLTKVPAYLVNVVPTVTLGDKKNVSRMEVSLGSVQKMVTSIKDGTGTTMLDDSIYAGSMYAINLDLQRISIEDAEAAEARLKAAELNYSPENTCTPEILGALLDYSGKYYFSLCDSQAVLQSSIMNIDNSRQLALAFTGYQFRRRSSYGIVKSLEPGSFYIDVAYNSCYNISLDGNRDTEKAYNTAMGSIESYFEGYIWEQLIDKSKTCISTISVMKAALDKGITLRYITKTNIEQELASCNIEDYVRREIRDYVNRGMCVELVPETLTIGDWTGTAYIAYDMNTGSASYLISGGTAGGSSMKFDFEDLFQINMILATVNMEIGVSSMVGGYAMLELGVGTLCPELIWKGATSSISAAFTLGSAFQMRYDTLDFIFRYVDEGDDCLRDFLFFTGKNLADTVMNLIGMTGDLFGETWGNIVTLLSTAYSGFWVGFDMADGAQREDAYGIVSFLWDTVVNIINAMA